MTPESLAWTFHRCAIDSRRTIWGGWRLGLPLLGLGAAACAGGAPAPGPAPVRDDCVVVPTEGGSTDVAAPPVVLGVSGAVDPANAPVPRTPAEAVVFTQLYETLVEIGCDGRARPGIAESWSREGDGRAWTFRLRRDVRDWRGEGVTAASVASGWRTRPASSSDVARWFAPPPPIEELTVLDSWTVRVAFARPVTIEHFALLELAVTTTVGADGWPVGTGAYRPAGGSVGGLGAGASGPAGGSLPLRLEGAAKLEVRELAGDARDALDAGVDVMITYDPAVVEYADASPAFSALPLAWDRTYLLLTAAAGGLSDLPTAGDAAGPGAGPYVLSLPVRGASALARDAVRIDARAPLEGGGGPCAVSGVRPEGARSPPARRIVYPATDPLARSLAERLVALALAPERPESSWLVERVPELTRNGRVAASGLTTPPFQETLRSGTDAAYVLGVPRRGPGVACDAPRSAAALAPWLVQSVGRGAVNVPAVLPLLEVRSTLVVREDVAGIGVDGLGALRLERMHRRSRGATP